MYLEKDADCQHTTNAVFWPPVKTCHTFNVPALQALWRNLFNPIPLFLTMLGDLWQVEETGNPLFAPT